MGHDAPLGEVPLDAEPGPSIQPTDTDRVPAAWFDHNGDRAEFHDVLPRLAAAAS
jgi:hypothetical protein